MGFPLLNLPLVPFRDFLRMLEFSELIILSFCSQRCHSTTKWNLYKLNEWEICVVTDRKFEIILQNKEKEEEKRVILGVSFGDSLSERQRSGSKIESSRIGNTLFRVETTPQGYLTSYWPTDRIGMFECGKYVANLFQKEIHTVQFGGKSTWLMDLLAYIPQLSFSKVVFDTKYFLGVEMSLVFRVFEQCSSEHLQVNGLVGEAPRILRYGRFRTFHIWCGQWMSVRHVTTLKCSHISIMFSWWNNVHANKFLRRWVHGGMPRLESFRISLEGDIHIEEILDGLDQYVKKQSSTSDWETYLEWCTFYELEIVNKNRSTASITVDTASGVLEIAVHK